MATKQKKLSPSVAEGLPLSRKLSEGVQLFREYYETARGGHDLNPLFGDVEEYDELLHKHSGLHIQEARVLEIGFGARPHRQMILHSMGVDASGVDAEMPVLSSRPREFYAILRKNGAERAAKSLLRHALFDRGERKALRSNIGERGLVPRLDPSRLIVSDAGDLQLASASLDLVFS